MSLAPLNTLMHGAWPAPGPVPVHLQPRGEFLLTIQNHYNGQALLLKDHTDSFFAHMQPAVADLYQFRYRKFHFRYRLSESYHFRYRFLPLSLQGPIVTGIRTMERSYLCTYTMNVPTLRTFTRACSLLKTFSSSKLPSEALQFLPTIVTGNRYRDTYCYRKSLQDIVTETHIVTGNRYRKSLQRHIVTGNRYRKSLQRHISLQEIVTETHIVTGIF